MRISTIQLNRQAVDGILDLGAQTARTQREIASGSKILSPGDDPIGSSRIVRLNQDLSVREQYRRNADLASTQLGLEDAVLGQITEVLQRARELALQAGNGVQTASELNFIAMELRERFDELVALVNTRMNNGEYLFAGFQGDVQPFDVDGSVTFNGDEGQRRVQIDNGIFVPISDSGKDLFMDVEAEGPTFVARSHPGNSSIDTRAVALEVKDEAALEAFFPDDLLVEFEPLSDGQDGLANFTVRRKSDNRVVDGLVNVAYTPGSTVTVHGMEFAIFGQPQPGDRFFIETSEKQDMLTTVDRMFNVFSSADPETDADLTNFVGRSAENIDHAIDSILTVRAAIGARLNATDSAVELHTEVELLAKETISDIRDVDFAEAVSRLSFQSFLLEAAQESFVRINNLSLFNSLR